MIDATTRVDDVVADAILGVIWRGGQEKSADLNSLTACFV